MKELVHLSVLRAAAPRRKPGYLDECLRLGQLDKNTGLVRFTPENWLLLRQRFRADPALPSLATMAGNAAAAAGRSVVAAASGAAVTVSDDVYEQRLAVCKGCEFLRQSGGRCSKCGCWVSTPVTGKARLATEACPIGRW